MHYPETTIPDERILRAAAAAVQHVPDTYASETSKVAAVWRGFTDADLGFRPHQRSSTVADILKHQLLSERRVRVPFFSVCLRLLDRRVPPTYGPTADATWDGADPTTTVDAAARR